MVNQVKKILKNNMKLNIQVNSNILCKDLIKVSINEFNSIFQKEESQYYLEDSNDAIDKCYELWYPEDEETGEPDEDLPTFAMDQSVLTIGEKIFTLYVKSPGIAIKDQEDSLRPNIQDDPDVDSSSSAIISEKKAGAPLKRINTLGYLVTSTEENMSRKSVHSDEIIYHKSTATCWKCIIF